MNRPKVVARVVGFVTLAFAVFGLYQTVASIVAAEQERVTLLQRFNYFFPAFYFMTTINIGCFLTLGWCGIDQLRLKLAHLKLFVWLFVMTLLYSVLFGRFIMPIDDSWAAAAGATLPRLLLPFIILFPIWGSLGLWWVKKRMVKSSYSPGSL